MFKVSQQISGRTSKAIPIKLTIKPMLLAGHYDAYVILLLPFVSQLPHSFVQQIFIWHLVCPRTLLDTRDTTTKKTKP